MSDARKFRATIEQIVTIRKMADRLSLTLKASLAIGW